MKILYISGREPSYARNSVIINGLNRNNVDIILCADNSKNSFLRYIKVLLKFFLNRHKKYDLVFVGFFGQPLVLLIKRFVKKPIILDAFLSAYDTLVFDKKKVREGSMLAKLLYYLDKRSCQLADLVLLDTNEHITYFVEKFNLPMEKFMRVFIGAEDKIFYPRRSKKSDKFLIEFHGGFIPLQGVQYIIKAAKILENEKDIHFNIVGNGQTFKHDNDLAKKLHLNNLSFLGQKDLLDIPKFIAECDVGLGIFGDTEKTKRVIPNKAYEIIAMKKPLITSDTKASRELFTDHKNVLFCEPANPKSLADSIVYLKKNKRLKERIAQNGYLLFKEKCCPTVIGKEISNIFLKKGKYNQ